MAENKSLMWSLNNAQELIGALSAKASTCGYTVALGGSVLTKGGSTNDLNLFLIPNGVQLSTDIELLMWLVSKFGMATVIQGPPKRQANARVQPMYDANGMVIQPPPSPIKHKLSFSLKDRKITVIMV